MRTLSIGNWEVRSPDLVPIYHIIHGCKYEFVRAEWTIPKDMIEIGIMCHVCEETSPPLLTTFRLVNDY